MSTGLESGGAEQEIEAKATEGERARRELVDGGEGVALHRIGLESALIGRQWLDWSPPPPPPLLAGGWQCASARQPLTSAALISPARRGVTPPPPPPPPLPGGGERLAGLRGTAPRVPGPATRHGSHGFFAGVTTPCNSTLAHDGSNTAQELNAEAP
ncbi:unnamed protein product [Lampetra fluviatilis]